MICSAIPDMIRSAAIAIVCDPEEQKRLTVTAGTESGSPARNDAIRATFVPDSASGIAQPRMTSSIASGATPGGPSARPESPQWAPPNGPPDDPIEPHGIAARDLAPEFAADPGLSAPSLEIDRDQYFRARGTDVFLPSAPLCNQFCVCETVRFFSKILIFSCLQRWEHGKRGIRQGKIF